MSIDIKPEDIHEMRSFEDENGEVFLSVNDLVNHLKLNKHRMNEVVPEHITADRFIQLLRTFEKAIKEIFNEPTN